MNNHYRIVWNESKQSWTAVSELAKGRSKSSSAAISSLDSPSSSQLSSGKKTVLTLAVASVLCGLLSMPALAQYTPTEEDAALVSNESITSDGTAINSGRLKDTLNLTSSTNSFTNGFKAPRLVYQGSAGSLTGNIVNNSMVIFTDSSATESTYAGNMSGTGSVEKIGSGTSILTGTNTYKGGTIIKEGGLNGNTNSLQGNIQVNENTLLAFDQSAIGSGTLNAKITGTGGLGTYGTGTLTLGDNVTVGFVGLGGERLNVAAGKTLTATGIYVGTSIPGGSSSSILGIYAGTTTAIRASTLTFGADSVLDVMGDLVPTAGEYTLIKTENGIFGTDSYKIKLNGVDYLLDKSVYQAITLKLVNSNRDLVAGFGLVWSSNNAHGNFNVADGKTATVADNLANNSNPGAGFSWDGQSLTKTGTGKLILTGNNTYTGATTIEAGTLQGNTASIKGNVTNAGALVFNQNSNGTFANTITGTGSFTKEGTGSLTLTGANDIGGDILVAAGTLQSSAGSFTGNIENNTKVIFNESVSAESTYAGKISGTGSVEKTGWGNSIITGTNTYKGGTTIKEGALIGNTNSLQGNIQLSELGLLTFDQTAVGSGTFNGKITGAGGLNTIGTGTLTLGDNVTIGAVGIIGGRLNIAAGKTLTATQAMGFSGVTVENGATLGIHAGPTTAIKSTVVNFASGSILDVLGDSLATGGEYTLIKTNNGISGTEHYKVKFNGQDYVLDKNMYQAITVKLANSGKDLVAGFDLVWNNGSNAHGDFNVADGKTATVADNLANNSNPGAGFSWDGQSLTKTGTGTLLLTGNNSYTGNTTIEAGTLQGNTASIKGNVTNAGALVFNQNSNGTFANTITGTGSFTKEGTGSLTLTGANNIGGGITVAAGTLQGDSNSLKGNIANNAKLVFNQAADGTHAGLLSGTGSITKQGAGTLTLTGTNTHTGNTTVTAGGLQGNTNSLKGNIANSAKVIFNQTANGTYSGTHTGTGVFTKTGAGDLTLANNLNAGSLNVDAGTLLVAAGKKATVTGNVNVTDTAKLGLDVSSNPAITAGGAVNLNNTEIKITGTDSASDVTYKLISSGAGINGAFNVTVDGNSLNAAVTESKYIAGTAALSANNKDLNVTYGLVWNSAGPAHGTFDVADTFTLGVALKDRAAGSYVDSFSWAGNKLTKKGTGTLILTGANTYTGGTDVLAGTLQGNTTSLKGNIANSAQVTFAQTTDGTYAGVISGTGTVKKEGTGKLNLTGANNASTGTLAVAEGSVQGGAANFLGGGIANNANVIFNQVADGTYTGALSGAGTFTKQGAGKLTLAGNNTHTGKTTVAAGTMEINGNLTNWKGDIINNADLVFKTALAGGTYTGVLSGSGTITVKGTSSFVLAGANTNTGEMIVTDNVILHGDTTSLQGKIKNNATLMFIQSADGTFAGTLTGTGTLNKTGAGNLILNSNIQTGQLTVAQGGLSIAAGKKATVTGAVSMGYSTNLGVDASNKPSLKADTLDFTGNNKLEITGYDSSTGDLLLVQTQNGITGNFTATTGGVVISNTIADKNTYLAGEVKKANGDKDIIGSFGLAWDHSTSAHGTFNITGASDSFAVDSALTNKTGPTGLVWDRQSLEKQGVGTLILNGQNTYTGITDIQGGKLLVGGTAAKKAAQIAGDVSVKSGATLGGHGKVLGAVTVANGATLAPGSSVGVLSVGSAHFQSGSTFEFEAGAGGADKLIANSALGTGDGSVTIDAGANLKILGGAGAWRPNQTYTLIDANGGITGQFDNVTKDTVFLNHNLIYNADNIQLHSLRNSVSFNQVAATYNQASTAFGLETLGGNNILYQQIVGMNALQAQNAYDMLSGEIHGSVKSALLTNSRHARSAIKQHLNETAGILDTQTDTGKGLWINAWGHDGKIKSDNNAAKLDNKGVGFLVGMDALSTDTATAGLALGYEHNDMDTKGTHQSNAKSKAVHMLGYGRASVGPAQVKGGIGYSWLDIDTNRTVALGGMASKNEANYNAGIFQAFVEGSHTFDLNDKLDVTPYAGLSFQRVKTKDFIEKGYLGQLAGSGSSTNMVSSNLGVRGQMKFTDKASVYADLGWEHNFNGVTPDAQLNFLGGGYYKIKGVKANEDSAIIGVGGKFQIKPNMSLSMGYEGELGNRSQDHGVKVLWELRF